MSENQERDTYSEGDTVILEDTHHSHNSELKKNEGRRGEVRSVQSGGKCLVKFEGQSLDPLNQFWVAPKWLSRCTEGESDE